METKIYRTRLSVILATTLICCLLLAAMPLKALAATAVINKRHSQSYTIVNTITVRNPSGAVMNNVRLEVPIAAKSMGDWQDFLGEEFLPNPIEIIEQSDNTRFAVYNLTIPAYSSVRLIQKQAVTNYALDYQLNFSSYEYDAADLATVDPKYLQAEPGVEVGNSSITTYTNKVIGDAGNPYLMARRLFSDINLFMTYDDTGTTHSALQAINTGRGNCVDYSNLYIACLRTAGIPAREYTGYVFSPDEHIKAPYLNANGSINLEELRHNWVEFYVAGVGWLVADPTFTYLADVGGTDVKMVDWDRFAMISRNNRLVTLYPGSDLDASIRYNGSIAPVVEYDTSMLLFADLLPYNDLTGHWAAESVTNLRNWNTPIVQGITATYFGVNQNITRGELVTMINRVLDFSDPLSADELVRMNFSDLSTDYWGYAEVQKAVSRGFVQGFPDGTFQANKAVTRAEMATILNNVANLPTVSGSPFTDLNQSGYAWARAAIENNYNAGLAQGITATTFVPQKQMTRGEASVFIDRWLRSAYYTAPTATQSAAAND